MSAESAQHIPPVWKVWRNPLVWRYAHSRLRLRPTIFWSLLVIMVTYFAAIMTYLPLTLRGVLEPVQAARNLLWVALFVQMPILLLLGTWAVAYGTVSERLSGALDYQRMTPLTPAHKIIGYLFGLPIREYLLFCLTLPVVIFATIVGDIPVHKILIVYLLFGTSAILYHMTALALGMVINKWWVAAFGTQLALFFLYIVLPQLSNLQIHLFESLTLMPAAAHYLGEYMLPHNIGDQVFFFGKIGTREVPFFNYAVPQTLFSLVLQLGFMAVLFTMQLRKWVQEHYHALSKRQSVLVLVAAQLLLVANLWPIFTTDLSGEVQARFPLPVPPQAISVAITTAMILLLLVLGVWLVFVVTPDWHAYKRGLRRTKRLGLKRIPFLWDESPTFWVYAVVAGSSTLVISMVLWLLAETGYFELIDGGWTDRLPGAFALGGVLFLVGTAVTTLERGKTLLGFLVVGILPIMIAMILTAVNEEKLADPAFFVVALSPLGTLILSLVHPNLPPQALSEVPMMGPATWCGLALMVLYCGVLIVRWCRHAAKLRKELQ